MTKLISKTNIKKFQGGGSNYYRDPLKRLTQILDNPDEAMPQRTQFNSHFQYQQALKDWEARMEEKEKALNKKGASLKTDVREQKIQAAAKSLKKPLTPALRKELEKVYDLQTQLVRDGYDVGKTGADALWGGNTEAALQKAIKDGKYHSDSLTRKILIKPSAPAKPTDKKLDLISNPYANEHPSQTVKRLVAKTKKQQKTPQTASTNQLTKKQLEADALTIQKALLQEGYNLGKWGADGNWGDASQAAYDKALADGYSWDGTKLTRNVKYATPHVDGMWQNFLNSQFSDLYDNMYPYSYGDITDTNGVTRQVTGKESKDVQARAAIDKIQKAREGIDPRRDLLNRMAAVDLNSENGMAEWRALVEEANKVGGMVRYRGTTPEQIRNQQWEMRARLDAMNLHQGRNQQWNTFIEQQNKDKLSGAATRAGRPTLIIADSNQRRRINGEMLNYWKTHQNEVQDKGNGIRILPFMSYLGNASIVEQPDKSLRYTDNWDYAHDETLSYEGRPYFGEVLSDFSGDGYSQGVNSRAFSEGLEDFTGALLEPIKQKTQGLAQLVQTPSWRIQR